MYLDEKSETIAFNRNNSLFFNLRYFIELDHARDRKRGLVYWYMTAAHELAHTFEAQHNSRHEVTLTLEYIT